MECYITKVLAKESFVKLTIEGRTLSKAKALARGITYAVNSFDATYCDINENCEYTKIYGWQDLRLRKFWKLGQRLLGNCDVPDLDLFPKLYPSLKSICFQAGLEL